MEAEPLYIYQSMQETSLMKEKRSGNLRRILQRVRATFDRRAEEKKIEQERRAEEERRTKPDQRSGEGRRSDE